jgi:DNA-directed RNA polymerase subunit alpha
MPQVEVVHASADFGRFLIRPLERGFGTTIGNALRRVLLSSLPGAAVTSVKVDGIYHEFATVPGVKEDTTELILNVKQLRLKSHSDGPVLLRIEATGPGVVTAADIIAPSEVEIVNPELHIATLDSPDARLEMELTVERGHGYVPADGRESPAIGVIPVDAVYTPVRRANYIVEPYRVGSRTDLDQVTIEVQTDATMSPVEALARAAEILIAHFQEIANLQAPHGAREKPALTHAALRPGIADMPIEQLDLSARTYNCLKRSGITKVGQVLQMSEEDLLALRNFGQKSLQELREKLREHGITPEEEPEPARVGAAREAEPEDEELGLDFGSDEDLAFPDYDEEEEEE